ncbi:hypothetical protein LX32DRAFT_364336 [Colletotrichum zoysiae]|uniref:Uncharacterized protein n=1 Tax=Colletotrichum zoysiae TaxID=1216348 RepID=A0AAD9HJD7_9PEZI|nr:hypothetical protein LX32DRAFT_364336 [Colletotrichum zoysiae]
MVGGRDKGWSVSTPTFIIRYPRLLAKGPPVFSFSLSIRSRSYGDLGQERTTGVWTYPPAPRLFTLPKQQHLPHLSPKSYPPYLGTHPCLLALPSLSQAAAHTFLGPFGGPASLLFLLAFSFSLRSSPWYEVLFSVLFPVLCTCPRIDPTRAHTHTHTHTHTHPPTHHPKVIQARLPQVLLLLLLLLILLILLQLLSTRHADVHCYQPPCHPSSCSFPSSPSFLGPSVQPLLLVRLASSITSLPRPGSLFTFPYFITSPVSPMPPRWLGLFSWFLCLCTSPRTLPVITLGLH